MDRGRAMDRDRAVKLLRHYFKTSWDAAGFTWDQDNSAEVEILVDSLIGGTSYRVESALKQFALDLLRALKALAASLNEDR